MAFFINKIKKKNMYCIRKNRVTVVYWKLSKRLETFKALSGIFKKYTNGELGVAKNTLYQLKMAEDGYENDIVVIKTTELQ
jgi:hypothetical protein